MKLLNHTYFNGVCVIANELYRWSREESALPFPIELEANRSSVDFVDIRVSMPLQHCPGTVTSKVPSYVIEGIGKNQEHREDLLRRLKFGVLATACNDSYIANYDLLLHKEFGGNAAKSMFGHRGLCKFCSKAEPMVSFRSRAHAIPASLGNKRLFSLDECDLCNEDIGRRIENDFGNWSLSQRVLSFVSGSSGFPNLTIGDTSCVRNNGQLVEIFPEGGLVGIELVENRNQIKITLPTLSYTPISVYKAFVKMALSLMPVEELVSFRSVIEWVMASELDTGIPAARSVLVVAVPGPNPFGSGYVKLYKRKEQKSDIPFMTLVVASGNCCYQIAVPSDKDKEKMLVTPYAYRYGLAKLGCNEVEVVDLSGKAIVKQESCVVTLTVEGEIEEGLKDSIRRFNQQIQEMS